MFEHIVRRRRPGRDRVAQATVVSVAVHAAIVLLLIWGVREGSVLLANENAGTGPDSGPAGGGGGGGGGEQVTYYEIPMPQPAPVPPPAAVLPVPVPPPPPPTPTPEARPEPTRPAPAPAPAAQGGTGAGEGAGQGTGAGPGAGPGSGGGSGGGTGGGVGSGTGTGAGPGSGGGPGSVIPPTTDLLLLPPDKPRGMAARDVTIRFFVNRRGRVTRVEVLNPTGNRRYDDELRRRMAEYEFTPGRDARTGEPVDAATDITITI